MDVFSVGRNSSAIRCVAASLLMTAGCTFGDGTVIVATDDAGGTLQTTVSGLVWRDGPIAETIIVVRDASGPVMQGRTDGTGRFDLALGPLSSVVEIEADGLRQRIDIPAVGDDVTDVLVSPIGSLTEAYIDSPVAGSRAEKTEIVAAFFQIPLSGDNLSAFDQRLGDNCADVDDIAIGPPALAGLLQAGIRYLGQSMLSEGSGSGRADDLLGALVQDLESDGFLDGIGFNGQPLQFAGIPLDAFTLRSAYINALTAFLRSGRNQSGFDASCFKRFFDEILLSRSPLFPAATWINAPFDAGCAACTQLENGDFACTAGDCGPCGRCEIDFSGETPVAACAARDATCPGNCDQCVPAAEDGKFECAPQDTACGGDCSQCSADGNGGFSCQSNTDRCIGSCAACTQSADSATDFSCTPQPAACAGNCNLCQPVAGDTPGFSCVPTPTACNGNCAACADDGSGGFSCQANLDACPGPTDGSARCNECQPISETEFRCVDQVALCPATSEVARTACNNPTNVCALTGTQQIEVSSFQCLSGACVESVNLENRSCSRDTDGNDCGTLRCTSPWSTCQQTQSGTCDTDGEERRTCQQSICSTGSCSGNRNVTERRDCVYNPGGQLCGEQSCGASGRQLLCCTSGFPYQCNVACSACEG